MAHLQANLSREKQEVICIRTSIALRELSLSMQVEHSAIQIIDGNWGVFEKSFPNHMHSYYELHYVSGGQGTLIMNHEEFPLSRGCAYLIPPKIYHEQRTDQRDKLEEYHLAFVLTSAVREDPIYRQLFAKTFFCCGVTEAEPLLDAVFKEITAMQYGYKDMILGYLQSVFILLMRAVHKPDDIDQPSGVHLDDQRVMMTDESLLYEYKTITLPSLSSRLKLSPRQTQRFIQEKYGEPFSVLKTRSKLNHAVMLLSSTDLSVDEICYQVGYQNGAYFNKVFKTFYRMSPSDSRKNLPKP